MDKQSRQMIVFDAAWVTLSPAALRDANRGNNKRFCSVELWRFPKFFRNQHNAPFGFIRIHPFPDGNCYLNRTNNPHPDQSWFLSR